ncbi:VWA domain-containing protein, partial [bacterium]|nr:VWA domain-containing protein [bacterium]
RSQKSQSFALLTLCLVFFPAVNGFTQDELNVNIAAVNTNYFPQIHLYVQVTDEDGEPIMGLAQENFDLLEDNQGAYFDVRPYLVEGTSFGLALDCSGSMGSYQDNVVEACTTFINNMRPLDNASIIFYESYNNTQVMQPMTNNQAALINAANQYYASGQTALWYGYYLALEQCQEELIPRVLIGFTDGQDNQSYSFTLESVALFARSLGCPIYTIGIGSVDPGPMIEVAELTHGQFIHTTADSLEFYYNQIQRAYQYMYEVAYISPNPLTNGGARTPEVLVDAIANTASDTVQYAAPWVLDFAPRITLTPGTLDTLMTEPQLNNTPLTVQAWVVDNDVLTLVRIKHRRIGETTWNHGAMANVSDSLYSFTFEDWYVQDPGIEFYLIAIDSYMHVINMPQYNPGLYPYQVHVLPNTSPWITHEANPSHPAGTPMFVSCEAMDTTNSIERVELFFRMTDEIFNVVVSMDNIAGNTWEGEIFGYMLEANEYMIYFIRAWDNYGAYVDNGPHLVQIVTAVEPPEGSAIPATFKMHQNFPNPFNAETTLLIDLVRETPITLSIYDLHGRLVNRLSSGELYAPGSHRVVWNGTNSAGQVVGAGIYFAELVADHTTEMRKMVLLH